ncbi:MAG: aminotransferase class I/II-fold pyridoxal phosphate-dependent enzyme [Eubacterium sp.]
MKNLYNRLTEYVNTDIYAFHMPGHKRSTNLIQMDNPAVIDITEIEGFDNLHNAKGILKQAMEDAAEVYKSKNTFFLVNGSTGGMLSAISAVAGSGDKVIFARNNHKSSYNALQLRGIIPVYITPEYIPQYDIMGGITPEAVKSAITTAPETKAVVIVSPTYEGIVSDIEGIASVCHNYNIPLIVDSAHGAHFIIHSIFPKDAVECKADIVVESLHKTMPALTQTALMHVNGQLVNMDKIKQFLSIYQTSSPSYVLMSSIDNCIQMLKNRKNVYTDEYVNRLITTRQALGRLQYINIPGKELIGKYGVFDYDISKIILSVKNSNISGKELYQKLLDEYHLQMEMAGISYVLAMTSIGDTKEGFERLKAACIQIDLQLYEDSDRQSNVICHIPKMKIVPQKACELSYKTVLLEDAAGEISAEYIYLYPPGIPLIVPGEILNDNIIDIINYYKKQDFEILGPADKDIKYIRIIRDK